MGKTIRCVALSLVAHRTCGVRDPEHVRKLFARKPGGPRGGRLRKTVGPVGEGQGRTPDMYTPGKSDEGIVSMKRMNKSAQPKNGQPPAEFVEKSPSAKGNCVHKTVTSTQWLEATLIGLDRVRETVKPCIPTVRVFILPELVFLRLT